MLVSRTTPRRCRCRSPPLYQQVAEGTGDFAFVPIPARFDAAAMLTFVTTLRDPDLLRDGYSGNGPSMALAPDAIARSAFIERPDTWHVVEIVPDAFEEVRLDCGADVALHLRPVSPLGSALVRARRPSASRKPSTMTA
jgi:hypothetical protein